MTAILGAGQTDGATASAWASRSGAAGWFCDLAATYWQLAPERGGVRPEVAFCDFAKETGFGRFGGTDPQFSASQAMHNPCGLKTADGSATASFPDWPTGITAHLDHLALYAGAPGYPRAGSPDPRPFPSLHGECPTVESLGGHWSPSADYGTTLVADYLTPLLGGPVSAPTLCPFAKEELISHNTGGAMSENIGLVVHEAEGDGDLYGWFNNPNAQVSAHFWVGKDGTLCQYVPADVVAWAEMAGNDSYLSVETEGFATEAFTDAQIATLAKLIAWGHQVYGWPLELVDHGAPGITTHCHYPSGAADPNWGDHTCPGPIRLGQMPAVLQAAAGGGPAAATFVAAAATADGQGYWLARSDGQIVNEGDAQPFSLPGGTVLAKPVVGAAGTPAGQGVWLAAADGGVFNFGGAGFYGSAGGVQLAQPVVDIAATPDGKGYWLVAADGGVFAYGDAGFHGSPADVKLAASVVGIAGTPSGKGYWLVAADGGVFNYGDAGFYGSPASVHLAKPVVGVAATPTGKGYWLVASDGGVFNYGDARFYGSAGGVQLAAPVVGICPSKTGAGYGLIAADGGVFAYGDFPFKGSPA